MSKRDQKYFLDVASAVEHLQDELTPLSPAALMVFSNPTAHTVQQFARVWVMLSPERRRKIAQTMVELTEDSFEANYADIYRYLLDDDDADVRVYAVDGLWEEEMPALIKPLVALVRSDPASRVRAAAASSLARFALLGELKKISPEQSQLVRATLIAVIRNSEEDIEVRRRAIESVAIFGDEEVRDIIAAAYENDDPRMRASAVFAMGHSADKYWSQTVLNELDSQDAQLRYEAARASGELELKKAVPRLVQLIDDPDIQVAEVAIAALGQIGGPEARQVLEQIIRSEDETMSEAAQDALDELTFAEGANLLLVDVDVDRELEDLDLAELDEDEDEEDDDGDE